MSYVDVKLYYNQIENQYLKMVDLMNRVDVEYKNGLIPEEQFNQYVEMISKIKDNYERLSYIMFLFNIPKSKDNKKKFAQKTTKLDKGYKLLGVDKKTNINENTYVLQHIENELNKLKDE